MQNNSPIRRLIHQIVTNRYILLGLFLILIFLFILDWFVSVPWRAARIDRYILFSMSETAHFYYAKNALTNPFIFINPNAKPLYAILSSAFLAILPFGLFSLKILNSLFSVAILFILYKLIKKNSMSEFAAVTAVIFTMTFPLFFLVSISALSELSFCFVIILALYLLYTQKFLYASILVSLLPLIR